MEFHRGDGESYCRWYASALGSIDLGYRKFFIRTKMRNRWLAGSLIVYLFATFVNIASSGLTINLFKYFAVGVVFGIATVAIGEVFRWREFMNLGDRPRYYWQYRKMTLRTAFTRATTEDYGILVQRDPEGWHPNVHNLIRRARKSGEQITETQWETFFYDKKQWFTNSKALYTPLPFRQASAYESGVVMVVRSGTLPSHWYLRLASHSNETVRWTITQSPYAPDEAKVTAALLGME